MNTQQLKLFLRHAFSLEESALNALKKANPAFARAMWRIRDLVGTLPDEGLMREKEWRALLDQVAVALEPYNREFGAAVVEELALAAPEMKATAEDMLRRAGPPVPPGVSMPVQDSVRMALNSKVNSTRLSTLFELQGSGLSPWIKSNIQVIDRTVKTGILQGKPTKDIADEIAVAMVRNGQEALNLSGPTAAKQIRAQASAVARTAIQDMNRQVTEAVWRDNSAVIDKGGLRYEWVAALDSRTCPTCGPLDGVIHLRRADFPSPPPIHVNCRCRLILMDPDDPDRIRSGQVVSEKPMSGERAYKTKVSVKGKKLHRKAVTIELGKDGRAPSYADYLAQVGPKKGTAATETQRMFFGGGNAGNIRAVHFNKLVQGGMSPEVALQKLVVGDPARRGFVPVDKLPPVKKTPTKRAASTPKPAATATATPKAAATTTRTTKPTATPKPAATPAVKPATMRQLSIDSPSVGEWMKEYGGSGRLVDDALTRMEAEGGLIAKHTQQLRQFAEQNQVMSHFSMREKVGDMSAHYASRMDTIIESQRRTVAAMRKIDPDGIRTRAAQGVLDDLQQPGHLRNRALETLFGNVDRCGGYTRPTTGAVNVYLNSKSKPLGQLGMAELKRRTEDNLADVVKVAAGEQVPLPFATFSGVNKKIEWLGIHIHELGHQVHNKGLNGAAYGGVHKKKGGVASVSQYGLANEQERFAEAYVQYVFNPEGLKKHAPGLYSWVEEAVTNALKL